MSRMRAASASGMGRDGITTTDPGLANVVARPGARLLVTGSSGPGAWASRTGMAVGQP